MDKKTKLTVYIDDETRNKLNHLHAYSIKINEKKTMSWFVGEAIKALYLKSKDKNGRDN